MSECDAIPGVAVEVARQSPRVAVVQDGARLHYAVPLSLQRAGALRLMFSETFFPAGSPLRALLNALPINSSAFRSMLERRCDEIDPRVVRRNLILMLRQQQLRRKIIDDEAFYARSSELAGQWIDREGFADANVLFGFVRNIDPTLLARARSCRLRTVVDQFIAPAAIELAEAAEQRRRWPAWKIDSVSDLSRFEAIEQMTWERSDRITCASDYVAKGLVKAGVAADRIVINPYPVAAVILATSQRATSRPIIIGFVGEVGLRKGAPYFGQIAERLASANVRFAMIGPVRLSDIGRKKLEASVELRGRVVRSDIATALAAMDIFLFPSTCEGSATAVMEAMASGLPIVTTPNSGTIVRDSIDGFIRQYDDIDGMCDCLGRLIDDVNLRRRMGDAARQAAEECTLERFGSTLLSTMRSLTPQ